MTTGPVTRRKGVASVIGAIFMVVIFMVAVGTQVYLSGIEAQSAESAQQGELVVSQRASESLSYVGTGTGLSLTNGGTVAVRLVAMLLKFENGTIYDLNPASTPPFPGSAVPSGVSTQLQPLVPSGVCSPGTATCSSKYQSIISGAVPGREVGIVTSLGNTFWFAPSSPSPGGGSNFYHTSAVQSTTSSSWTPVAGLSFTGAPNAFYIVQFFVGYWQSNSANAVIGFGISVPSGATFLFCGGLFWADPAQSTTDFTPGNECTGTPNTYLGPTHNTQTWCNSAGPGCEWVGTAYVTFGPAGGTFSFEFEGASTDTANIAADSTIVVTLAG